MNIITILQVAVSAIIIVLVLLQERGAGASGLFGNSEAGFYETRRGLERGIFIATIVLVVVFAGLSILNLLQ